VRENRRLRLTRGPRGTLVFILLRGWDIVIFSRFGEAVFLAEPFTQVDQSTAFIAKGPLLGFRNPRDGSTKPQLGRAGVLGGLSATTVVGNPYQKVQQVREKSVSVGQGVGRPVSCILMKRILKRFL